MSAVFRRWLAVGAAAACGGVILATALGAATRTAAAGCQVSAADMAISAEEQEVYRLTNEFRASFGLPALGPNRAALRAASYHARDMATRNYYGHDTPDGSWYMMTRDCGMMAGAGENIAVGYSSARNVVLDGEFGYPGWAYHEGHRQNILSQNGSQWQSMGVALVRGGVWGTYWVQEFSTEAPDGAVTPTAQVTPPPTPTPTPTPTPAPATQTVLQVWVQQPNGQWFITDIEIPPWCLWHAVKTRVNGVETVVRLFAQECPHG